MKKVAIKKFTYTSLAALALSGVAVSLNGHHSVFAAEDTTTAAATTPTSGATDTADAGSAAATEQGVDSQATTQTAASAATETPSSAAAKTGAAETETESDAKADTDTSTTADVESTTKSTENTLTVTPEEWNDYVSGTDNVQEVVDPDNPNYGDYVGRTNYVLEYSNGTKVSREYKYTGTDNVFGDPQYTESYTVTAPDGTVNNHPDSDYYFDYGEKSLDGKAIDPDLLYSTISSGSQTTDDGVLNYSVKKSTENNQTLGFYLVDSTFTANDGVQQHAVRYFLDQGGVNVALADGSAFVVNPYGYDMVVTDPKHDVPEGEYSETFELGTGTLVAFFTSDVGSTYYGGNEGVYYSYYTDKKTGLTFPKIIGIVQSSYGIEDGSIFAVNPYDAQYGGIISVTRSKVLTVDSSQSVQETSADSSSNLSTTGTDKQKGTDSSKTSNEGPNGGSSHDQPLTFNDKDGEGSAKVVAMSATGTSSVTKSGDTTSYPQTGEEDDVATSFAGIVAVALASVMAFLGMKRRNN